MAAAAVFKLFVPEFTDLYLETIQKSNAGEKIDELVYLFLIKILFLN